MLTLGCIDAICAVGVVDNGESYAMTLYVEYVVAGVVHAIGIYSRVCNVMLVELLSEVEDLVEC
jgi:hypothetical protein